MANSKENPYVATPMIVQAAAFIATTVASTGRPVRFGAAAYLEVLFGHVSSARDLDLDNASDEELIKSAHQDAAEVERTCLFLEALDDALTFDDVADICECLTAEEGVGDDGDTWYVVIPRPAVEDCFTITL